MRKEQEMLAQRSSSAVGNHVSYSDQKTPHHQTNHTSALENHIGFSPPIFPSSPSSSVSSPSKLPSILSSRSTASTVASALVNVALDTGVIGGSAALLGKTAARRQESEKEDVKFSSLAYHQLPTTTNRSDTRTNYDGGGSGSGGGRGNNYVLGDNSRFSQLLTPTIIEDHFDQYSTASSSRQDVSGAAASRPFGNSSVPTAAAGPSGNERQTPTRNLQRTATMTDSESNMLPQFSYENPGGVSRQLHSTTAAAFAAGGINDISPDSGVSADGGYDDGGEHFRLRTSRPLQRRKTLPGGYGPLLLLASAGGVTRNSPLIVGDGSRPNGTSTLISSRPTVTVTGRSVAAVTTPSSPYRPAPSTGGGGGGYRGPILTGPGVLRKTANMGSMPDVTTATSGGSAAMGGLLMPREEVSLLSQRRREEMRRLREEEERRKQQEIVLRLGDIKVRGGLGGVRIVIADR